MNWVVVEVVIGLSFLFFLLSIVASALNEAIAGIFKLRARTLERGIKNLLTGSSRPARDDAGLQIVRDLYASPLVAGYGASERSRPSYLASRSFRNALLGVTNLLDTTAASGDPLRADEIKEQVADTIKAIPSAHLQKTLTTIWESTNHDAAEFRAGVERWFDRGMERVSGWYKRRTQLILFAIGLLSAVALNANAIIAANRLWSDDAIRDGLIAQVENQQDDTSGADALESLEEMGLPLGWGDANRPDGTGGWVSSLAGWLLTAFAISFGAAFWFDVLNKFANLRNAGKKPETTLMPTPTESSNVRLTVAAEPPPDVAR